MNMGAKIQMLENENQSIGRRRQRKIDMEGKRKQQKQPLHQQQRTQLHTHTHRMQQTKNKIKHAHKTNGHWPSPIIELLAFSMQAYSCIVALCSANCIHFNSAHSFILDVLDTHTAHVCTDGCVCVCVSLAVCFVV